MKPRWLIEYDNDNETYTEPDSEVREESIERDLRRFDGSRMFYCAISDTADGTGLSCLGEPERRVIEGDLRDGEELFHFVLAKPDVERGATERIRNRADPDGFVEVDPAEVFTAGEAVEIFVHFHRTKTVPPRFVVRRGKHHVLT